MLNFEDANLSNLELLTGIPIEYFIFQNVKFDDAEKIAAAIRQFSNLTDISYDESFSPHFDKLIKELKINVIPLAE